MAEDKTQATPQTETPQSPPDWAEEKVWQLAQRLHNAHVLNDYQYRLYELADQPQGNRLRYIDLAQGINNPEIKSLLEKTVQAAVQDQLDQTQLRDKIDIVLGSGTLGCGIGSYGGGMGCLIGGYFGGLGGALFGPMVEDGLWEGSHERDQYLNDQKPWTEIAVRDTFRILTAEAAKEVQAPSPTPAAAKASTLWAL